MEKMIGEMSVIAQTTSNKQGKKERLMKAGGESVSLRGARDEELF